MSWSLDLLPLPPCVELGGPPLSGLLWTLLLLFLWYCYRVGSDPPSCRSHVGALKSGSTLSVLSRSTTDTGNSAPKAAPAIAMETGEEEGAESYLTPV